MESANEERSILAIKNGDLTQYGFIVENYQQQLFKYCFHMLGQLQEAEDVTQDVFVKGLERLDQFQDGTSLKAWLYKIAYYECLNKLKRAQIYDRVVRLFSRSVPSFQIDPPPTGLEYNVDLIEGLLRLAPTERHIILQRIVEDTRFEEIAKQLDISYSAVKKRYERAIKKLRGHLMERGIEKNEQNYSYL